MDQRNQNKQKHGKAIRLWVFSIVVRGGAVLHSYTVESAALALAVGILLAPQDAFAAVVASVMPWPMITMAIAVCVTGVGLGAAAHRYCSWARSWWGVGAVRFLRWLLVMIGVVMLGGGLYALSVSRVASDHLPDTERGGKVAMATIAVESLEYGRLNWRIRGRVLMLDGKTLPHSVGRIHVTMPARESLRRGDILQGEFFVRDYGGPLYPGAFNLQRHFWFRGVVANGYAREILQHNSGPSLSGWDYLWQAGLSRLEQYRIGLSQRIEQAAGVDSDVAAIIVALTTGNRRLIDRNTYEDIRRAGLAHLLAVSGLHIGLMMVLGFSLVSLLIPLQSWIFCRVLGSNHAISWRSRHIAMMAYRPALVVSVAAGLAFTALAQFPLSAQRALLMGTLVAVSMWFHQRAVSVRSLAVAFIVVLSLQPYSLQEAGFQLSFAAMAAVIGTLLWMQQWPLNRSPDDAKDSIKEDNGDTLAWGYAPGAGPELMQKSRWQIYRQALVMGLLNKLGPMGAGSLLLAASWSAKVWRRVEMTGLWLVNSRILSLFLVSVMVTLFLSPLVSYQFHGAQVYGVITNMVAIPLFSVIVMPLLGLGLLTDLILGDATLWWRLVRIPLEGVLMISREVSSWPMILDGSLESPFLLGLSVLALLWWLLVSGAARIWGVAILVLVWVLAWIPGVFDRELPDALMSDEGFFVATLEGENRSKGIDNRYLWLGQAYNPDFVVRSWRDYFGAADDWAWRGAFHRPGVRCYRHTCYWDGLIQDKNSDSTLHGVIALTRSGRSWRRHCRGNDYSEGKPPVRLLLAARGGGGSRKDWPLSSDCVVAAFSANDIASCGGLALYLRGEWEIRPMGSLDSSPPWSRAMEGCPLPSSGQKLHR